MVVAAVVRPQNFQRVVRQPLVVVVATAETVAIFLFSTRVCCRQQSPLRLALLRTAWAVAVVTVVVPWPHQREWPTYQRRSAAAVVKVVPVVWLDLIAVNQALLLLLVLPVRALEHCQRTRRHR